MARYTKIPANTFKQIQINAGILLKSFTPATGTIEADAQIGATTGGINFTATPSYTDFGDDIDNCPKNMKELKRLESWEVKATGTLVTLDTAAAKSLIGAADIDGTDTTKVTPRNDLADADFADLWFVGDYSDKTGATKGGFVAVHLMNALSTGGFQIQTSDKAKGQFAFEYTAHYSMAEQDTVPFEVYIKAGEAEA
nr:MAG TPA: major tail protein [Caudoviricetes sp.]